VDLTDLTLIATGLTLDADGGLSLRGAFSMPDLDVNNPNYDSFSYKFFNFIYEYEKSKKIEELQKEVFINFRQNDQSKSMIIFEDNFSDFWA
jgi:hypothetical protein